MEKTTSEQQAAGKPDTGRKNGKIPKNVVLLGLVSFFNDIASEMLYPIIPLFLTVVLGAPVAIVGLIEGVAESTASLFKYVFGRVSDKYRSRKPFVTSGYSLSAVAKLVLYAAFSWHLVLVSKFLDRFGKGIRTSARDALIAESTPEEIRGKAFGFHRALDTAGAVLGPLLTIYLMSLYNANASPENMRHIFLIAFIPSVIGVLLLVLAVREKAEERPKKEKQEFKWADLDVSYRVFIIVSVIFALGNSSDAFLILRAKNLGLATTLTVLAYVLFNFVYALFSTPAGIISDRLGPRKVLQAGFFLFAVVYLLFGLVSSSVYVWILFPLYGVYMAITEGIGKAYISTLIPKEKLGSAYGIYYMAVGICVLISSSIAGLLWTYVSVSAPFIFGALMALIAGLVFILAHRRPK